MGVFNVIAVLVTSLYYVTITSGSSRSSRSPPPPKKPTPGHFAVPGSCPASSRVLDTWRRIQAHLSATERVALALEVAERLEQATPMGMKVVRQLTDLPEDADPRYVLIASTHALGDLLGIMHDDNDVIKSYVGYLVERRNLLPGTVADAMEAALHALFSVLAEVSDEISLNVWTPCLRRLLRHFRSLADDVTEVCARCRMEEGLGETNQPLSGDVIFRQTLEESRTQVHVGVRGFDVTDDSTRHVLHVHARGRVGEACRETGGRFTPHRPQHPGAPGATSRPFSYLGNVEANAEGMVDTSFSKHQVSLVGPHSVIGRSVAIHEINDDDVVDHTDESDVLIGCCVIHQVACE